MNTPIITFFNTKGGVGKTTLVSNLAWMYSNLGLRVIAADLDPQANLSMVFLGEDRLEELWLEGQQRKTIFGSVLPLLQGLDDISDPHLEFVEDQLALLAGDIALFKLENELAQWWSTCLDTYNPKQEFAFRMISAFWRIMQRAARLHQANIILMDLAPTLGAINRAALIAADYIAVPLTLDLFALHSLPNLGVTLQDWREQWQERLAKKNPEIALELPLAKMQPIGYVVLQHSVRFDRPVKTYQNWLARIPEVYQEAIWNNSGDGAISVANDPNCLAILKNYHSLMSMAQVAQKPIFQLKPADGIIGAHFVAVKSAYQDFEALARKIAERTGVEMSLTPSTNL
jgi:cellulose biosynthesis protein BcsQ